MPGKETVALDVIWAQSLLTRLRRATATATATTTTTTATTATTTTTATATATTTTTTTTTTAAISKFLRILMELSGFKLDFRGVVVVVVVV